MVYIIIKEGVHLHEIKGLFHYLPVAIKTAKGLITAEKDDHHAFDIYSCPVGSLVEDADLVASVYRNGEEVYVRKTPLSKGIYTHLKEIEHGDT